MNVEISRLKKKLAVMEMDSANQVFMDLFKVSNYEIGDEQVHIKNLKYSYKSLIAELEQKETKYEQGKLL
jgi:hypothetical protein